MIAPKLKELHRLLLCLQACDNLEDAGAVAADLTDPAYTIELGKLIVPPEQRARFGRVKGECRGCSERGETPRAEGWVHLVRWGSLWVCAECNNNGQWPVEGVEVLDDLPRRSDQWQGPVQPAPF